MAKAPMLQGDLCVKFINAIYKNNMDDFLSDPNLDVNTYQELTDIWGEGMKDLLRSNEWPPKQQQEATKNPHYILQLEHNYSILEPSQTNDTTYYQPGQEFIPGGIHIIVYRTGQIHGDDGDMEARDFLRSRLSDMLELGLQEVEVTSSNDGQEEAEEKGGLGIHIFQGSSIKHQGENEIVRKQKRPNLLGKRRIETEDDLKSSKQRFKEAAVTAEWVIQQSKK